MTADLKDHYHGLCARCGITLARWNATVCGDCHTTDPIYVKAIIRARKKVTA